MDRTHKEQRDQRDTAEQDRMSGIIVLKKCRFRNSKWHCHTTCGLLFLVFWLWLGKKTTVWEFKAHAVMWELFSLFSSALAPSLGFLWSCTEPKENIHHLKIRDQIVQRNCSSKGDLSRMFAKKKCFGGKLIQPLNISWQPRHTQTKTTMVEGNEHLTLESRESKNIFLALPFETLNF